MPEHKILIDECLDRRLAADIPFKHDKTVYDMNWYGLKNGELLRKAEAHFDVFITSDQNLSFQQNLAEFSMTVLVLHSSSNKLQDIRRLLPKITKALVRSMPGQAIHIP